MKLRNAKLRDTTLPYRRYYVYYGMIYLGIVLALAYGAFSVAALIRAV